MIFNHRIGKPLLWPGLPLIMEIDCTSEKSLNNTIEFLKLDKKNAYTSSKYTRPFPIL